MIRALNTKFYRQKNAENYISLREAQIGLHPYSAEDQAAQLSRVWNSSLP